MINIFEAKLSTEDRKELDSKLFGLPKERKYPLNDEEHIRKAIQFFNFCPKTKRNELATNINKRLRELDLKIEVSADNPFYRFINKDFVTESADYAWMPWKIEIGTHYGIPGHFEDEKHILEVETDMIQRYRDDEVDIDIIIEMNEILYVRYRDYIDFRAYSGDNVETTFYDCVDDIMSIIFNSLYMENIDFDTIKGCLDIFNDIRYTQCNTQYIYRQLLLLHRWFNRMGISGEASDKINECISRISKLLTAYHIDRNLNNMTICANGELILHSIFNSQVLVTERFTKLTKMLKDRKTKLEKQLYIMNMPNRVGTEFSNPVITDYSDMKEHRNLFDTIDYQFDSDKVMFIDENRCKTYLDEIDILRALRMIEISDVVLLHDRCGHSLYATIIDNEVYIILVNKKNKSQLSLLKLTPAVVAYFTTNTIPNMDVIFPIVRVNFVKTNTMRNRPVTEGFTIDEDGNMKITISSKKSYMDEYSQNHKLLVENWKNKNYEGVKKNLAFIFALINIIERDKKYINRDPKVVKARAFAINDFKTYLKKLTSVEKDFDFVEYYDKSEYDKLVVNVPKQTILGIKNLFKIILQ